MLIKKSHINADKQFGFIYHFKFVVIFILLLSGQVAQNRRWDGAIYIICDDEERQSEASCG